MKSRISLLFIVLNLMALAILLRAASIQIFPNERLSNLHKRQFETVVELHGRRGDITDRKGHELAVSTPVYSLFADPKIIVQRMAVANYLYKELGLSRKQTIEKLRNKTRFVWLARKLDRAKREEILAKNIKGLGFIEESTRVYPNDSLLANTIGFVGADSKGLEGLELQYNYVLSGQNKHVSMQRDARGRPLIVGEQIFNEAPDGVDLQLTVDRELQYILEQELVRVTDEQLADGAVGVVLDASTSEVLAMASVPTFNPNQPDKAGLERLRNRALSDAFEPGSVMKPILVAGALQKKVITPDQRIDCEGGQFKIGGKVIHESDASHDFHWINIAEILAYSSNIGAAKIGLGFGAENVRSTYAAFGFGEKTQMDLPGEGKGILQQLPWRSHLLANISFGHGVSVTALQIANAYAAIANGGWLRQPFIVKRVRDNESNESVETQVKTVRRVLTDDVANQVKMMLVGTTAKEGTGYNARVPGYLVAGKTGTAQKVNPNGRGYLKKAYIASFAGFLPANDPRIVIYIAVDNPKKQFYGGQVAAPVFARVASFAVREFGLAPVYNSQTTFISQRKLSEIKPSEIKAPEAEAAAVQQNANFANVPDLTGLTLREVLARVSNSDVDVKIHGTSGLVQNIYPAPGSNWPDEKDKKLEVRLAPDNSSRAEE